MLAARHFVALILICSANSAQATQTCRYLPTFGALQQQLPQLNAQQAVTALQKYLLEHDNAQSCELAEIERQLDAKEIEMIKLSADGIALRPHHIYRCNEFNPRTAQCQSPFEDGTAHPLQVNLQFKPLARPTTALQLSDTLVEAKLIGLYRTSLAAALDGKAAKPLPKNIAIKWKASSTDSILIAIYKTSGPWGYRKAVWYFQ